MSIVRVGYFGSPRTPVFHLPNLFGKPHCGIQGDFFKVVEVSDKHLRKKCGRCFRGREAEIVEVAKDGNE